jgi:hypothetical protein
VAQATRLIEPTAAPARDPAPALGCAGAGCGDRSRAARPRRLVDGGRLLIWDRPLTDAAVAARTPWLNDIALTASRLGSWAVVFPAAVLLASLAAVRSRALARLILVVMVERPGV